MSVDIIKYISEYNKENYKMYQFRVKKSDVDMIKKLDEVENRNAYLTGLILNDIKPDVLSIKQIKEMIAPIIEKYGVKEVYLFGSYARGEANRDSDIDIYCEKGNIRSLYDEFDFIEELKTALGKDVDLVTIGSEMNSFFKQQLDEDKIRIC